MCDREAFVALHDGNTGEGSGDVRLPDSVPLPGIADVVPDAVGGTRIPGTAGGRPPLPPPSAGEAPDVAAAVVANEAKLSLLAAAATLAAVPRLPCESRLGGPPTRAPPLAEGGGDGRPVPPRADDAPPPAATPGEERRPVKGGQQSRGHSRPPLFPDVGGASLAGTADVPPPGAAAVLAGGGVARGGAGTRAVPVALLGGENDGRLPGLARPPSDEAGGDALVAPAGAPPVEPAGGIAAAPEESSPAPEAAVALPEEAALAAACWEPSRGTGSSMRTS